jgi:SAM-dependent methyltransferase
MRRIGSNTRFISVLAQLPRPQHVLELGCGDDPEAALYFANSGITMLGVDRNSEVLCSIRAYYPRLVQADITRLPLHAHFDLIIARHPDIDRRRSDWQSALTTANNWLSPDGILLVTVYSAGEYEQVRSWLRITLLKPYPLLPDNLVPPALDGRDRFVMAYAVFQDNVLN